MARQAHFGDGRIIDHPNAVFSLRDWVHSPTLYTDDACTGQSGKAIVIVWMSKLAYEEGRGPMPGYRFVIHFNSDDIDALKGAILTGPVAGDINEAILEVASTIEFCSGGEVNPIFGSSYVECAPGKLL